MFPFTADPQPSPSSGTTEDVPGYEFDGRPPGRHRNGFPDLDVIPAGRHHRRTHRQRTHRRRTSAARSGPGRTLRVVVPVTVIAVGVASGLIVSVNNDRHRAPSASFFPPATLAGQDFSPYSAQSTRGVTLSQGRVTSSGAEVVAVGAETGQLVPRAQFFVSRDNGRSWDLGTVTAAGGGTPPPGHAARFVAGGAGEWAAVGPDAVWTSADGRAWTLTSAAGLPQLPGDQVTVLKRTSSGFIAAGVHVPGGGRSAPVIFLSADGTSWARFGPSLTAGNGRALDIRLAAAKGRQILIAGDVATGSGRTATVRTGGAWLSDDGGRSWTAVTVPTGHGAQDQFSDAAATADGFLLVRPATMAGVPAADVYRSGNGTAWTFAATLTTRAGFTPGLMNSSSAGAVLAGQSGRTLTAFTSPDGVRWRQAPPFGGGAEAISGVAATQAGAVIAAGTSGAGTSSASTSSASTSSASTNSAGMSVGSFGAGQLITVPGGSGNVRDVSLAAIPGGVEPQLAVNAVAAQDRLQVAVGSANGFPAAWVSANGGRGWRLATGVTPSVLTRPGIQQLTSVTHGSAGWLAVGGGTGTAPGHPVVIGSADGRLWSAADGEPAFTGSGLFTTQAAAGRDGYVIVGSQLVTPARTIAAAWWSAGLTGWLRAGDAVAGAPDGTGSSQMLAVTATADGFLAVGSHSSRPAAWTTAGGRTWTQTVLPQPAGATAAVLRHVCVGGRTVVAAGVAQTAAGQVPFAARSADGGRTWTESILPVPAGTAQVTALAAAAGRFTVTGTFGVRAGEQDVVVWTSPNGTTWQAATPAGPGLASPGIQAITGLAVSGRELTGVGFTATPAGEQPTLWQPPVR